MVGRHRYGCFWMGANLPFRRVDDDISIPDCTTCHLADFKLMTVKGAPELAIAQG